MTGLEVSAKTVEEAIRIALEKLSLKRDEVELTILNEGNTGGLFGIGSEAARIRVTPLTGGNQLSDDYAEAATVLQELLQALGLEGTVTLADSPNHIGSEDSTGVPAFNIQGEDLGILIGRRGQALAAFQYMSRVILAHRLERWLPIAVDIEDYRRRRYETLKSRVDKLAEETRTRHRRFTMEPMSPYERRLVHLLLADDPAITTESIGEGDRRRVVIMPRNG